jgi:hypothetical protein
MLQEIIDLKLIFIIILVLFCLIYPLYSKKRGYIVFLHIFIPREKIYYNKEPRRFLFWFFYYLIIGIVGLIFLYYALMIYS